MAGKKIGVSLPFEILTDSVQDNPACWELLSAYGGDLGQMLCALHTGDVGSIELRAVNSTDPKLIARAVKSCTDAGLQAAIHGNMHTYNKPDDFFDQYSLLPASTRYIIVLHALKDMDSTVSALQDLAAYGDKNMPNLFFALENERDKPGGTACQSCEKVAEALVSVAHPRVGACWDFGHFYNNVIKSTESASLPEDFLDYVIHTHIHGLGLAGRMHFPIDGSNLPIREYCNLLTGRDYAGVYNLELDFDRFYLNMEPRKSLEDSIDVLKQALDSQV